jgi:beta-glucanase (GH16 family)
MKLRSSGRVNLACLSLALLLFCSCKKDTSNVVPKESFTVAEKQSATAALTYQLVWADEFNGTAVNTADWNFETGAGGWGNAEQQYYRSQNAAVTGGNLVITAKKESFGGAAYTSARMTTKAKRQFTYGKMEARIKLPLGQGLWPAFWMLGANISTVTWPACGEIDVMEHINATNTVYGTIHWDNNGHAQYGGNTNTTPASYHVYSIEWNSSAIIWYVDGVKFHEANILNNINGTDEFHKPFFFIFNMAVGGNWPGQTIDNTKLPAGMFVDYIRVYQLK